MRIVGSNGPDDDPFLGLLEVALVQEDACQLYLYPLKHKVHWNEIWGIGQVLDQLDDPLLDNGGRVEKPLPLQGWERLTCVVMLLYSW